MKIQNIFLLLAIQFNLALSGLGEQNQEPLDQVVYLPLHGHHHVISLAPTLAHITHYHSTLDANGTRKLLGFHYYQPRATQNAQGLTLVKVSDKLWVLTNGDIKDVHAGHVIYNGSYYQEPKTFFPTSWTQEQLTQYALKLLTHYFNGDSVLEPFDTQAGKTAYSFSTYKFKLTAIEPHEPSIIIVVKVIPALANSAQIVTLYPVIDNYKALSATTLEKIALQQQAALQKQWTIHTSAHTLQAPQPTQNTGNSNGNGGVLQQSPLVQAAQNGDWQSISTLLEENAELYETNTIREQAFSCALSRNDVYSTLSLLNTKTINNLNKDGVTPLIRAVTQETPSLEILELLLGYGSADANIPDRYRLVPLMHALRLASQSSDMLQLSIAITQLLLEHKANPNKTDSAGNNVLGYAIEYLRDKAEPFIKPLLKAHADSTHGNNRGETALRLAQKYSLPKIAALLQKHADKKANWLHEHKATELMYAAYRGDTQQVTQLLAQQAPVDTQDAFGYTALYLACTRNHHEIVRLLVAAGASTLQHINGLTIHDLVQADKNIAQEIKEALHKAYVHQTAPLLEQQRQQQKANQEKKAATLQQFKQELAADHLSPETLTLVEPYVNATINAQGDTPFLYAIKTQKHAVVEQLLSLPVSQTNIDNALNCAYAANNTPVLTLLIASKKLTAQQLNSLWNKALEQLNYRVLDLIAMLIPEFRLSKILQAFEANNNNLAQQLLVDRPPLSTQHASSCLFKALELNDSPLLRLVLEHYPQTATSTNHLGQTPIVAAAFEDKPILFEMLYATQTNLDARVTLLKQLRADKIPKRIFDKIGSLLQAEEALIDMRDKEQQAVRLQENSKLERAALEAKGWTPLMLAIYFHDVANSSDSQEINAHAPGSGITPLMISTRHHANTAFLRLIMVPGINRDAQDNSGKTAVTHAIEHGNAEAIKWLITTSDGLTQAHQTLLKTPQARALLSETFIAEHIMPGLIRYNSIEAIKFLLDNSFKCFGKNKDGKTALHYAAEHNRPEIAILLLDAGIRLDIRDNNKATAQEIAAKLHIERMQHILHCYQVTADDFANNALDNWLKKTNNRYLIKQRNNRKIFVFIIAAINGFDDIIRLLFVAGFNEPEAQLIAFFEATLNNHTSIFAVLLEHGVDINSINEKKRTALMIAAGQGHTECIKFLIAQGAKVDNTDAHGRNALDFAIKNSKPAAISLLLQNNAKFKYSPPFHNAFLKEAASTGSADMVKLLLKLGVNPNAPTDGTYPLLAAAVGNHTDCVELLVHADADPNVRDSNRTSALLLACYKKNVPMVKALLKAKTDVDAQDKAGETALTISSTFGHTEIMGLLLEANANPNLSGNLGITPLFINCVINNQDGVELLSAKGASVRTDTRALLVAIEKGFTPIAQTLINNGANPNASDPDGTTALMEASDKGDVETIRALLAAGAKTDTQNNNGVTALIAAAHFGHLAIVELLLNAKANIDLQDHHNETALVKAIIRNHTDIVATLLNAKANPHIKNKNGNTALQIAKNCKHTDIESLVTAAIARWNSNARLGHE